jgi:hypothetical protein
VIGGSTESEGPRVEGRAQGMNADVCSKRSRGRRMPRACASAVVLALLAALALSASAFAAGETSYVLGSSVKAEGACIVSEPAGAAVNETTGDVYVLDRATGFVARFASNGECLGRFGPAKEAKASATVGGIAVDNSSASPSFGDVYATASNGKSIGKFSAEGTLLSTITNEFELIHGVAVDKSGTLWVYQGKTEETTLESFSDAAINTPIASIELALNCPPRRGLAVGPNAESFYVGANRENRNEGCENFTVAVKLNGAGETDTTAAGGEPGGPAFLAQLDNDAMTGFGVNQATGEVFFDHGTYVTAFSPSGLFVQRFGDEAGESALQAGAGVAVDASNSAVYVIDAREGGFLDTFVPKTFEEVTALQRSELADGRAWEQITPQNKLGSSIYPITKVFGQVQASEDGSAITYTTNAPIVTNPPTNRAPEPTQNLSRRGSSSWSVEDIIPPAGNQAAGYAGNTGTFYEAFSYDLSSGFMTPAEHEKVTATEPLLSPESTESATFKRDLTRPTGECEPLPSSCYVSLVSPLNESSEVPFGPVNGKAQVKFTSASPDGQHAVLLATVPLTPEGVAQNEPEGLYEWAAADGSLKLVSVFPAGEGPGESGPQLRLGGPGENNGSVMRNAISADGSRIVWSTGAGTERLYLRDTVTGETIRVDSKQGVAKQPKSGRAVYQTASADTRRIFFTDVTPLTEDATTSKGEEAEEEAENRGLGDLYVCEVPKEAEKLECTLKDLTAEVKAANEEAGVQGVIGASEDGTFVYFVADANLGAHGAAGNCVPRVGAEIDAERVGALPALRCSLYVEHFNGTSWEAPAFVASLSSLDHNDWFGQISAGGLSLVTSRVSPNGEYLAFMSQRSLTGYENVDVNPVAEGARDEEVFLYHAGANVQCVSCKPGGAPPQGVFDTIGSGEGQGLVIDRAEAWRGLWVAANIPGWTGRSLEGAVYQSRYLSNSGRLFFNSADALVPAAEGAVRKEKVGGVETSVGVSNVYEFEPGGVGDCASETGCISLISGGGSQQESAFLDASVNGNDAFFLTAQPLAGTDTDAVNDVYDARVCTAGSPCITPPPPPPPPCSGEACKGSVTSVPAAPGTPPTTQPGPGNIGAKIEVRGGEAKKPPVTKKPPPLTRAQKLKKALKKCGKIKNKKKRTACVKAAKKKYGPVKKKGKK